MRNALALLLATPWIVTPLVTLLRARKSRSLDEQSDVAPPDAPLISAIVPARNETRNIERCVRSILASSYPQLEVIVVDDHSTDDTPAILQRLSATDRRLRVVNPPPLHAGWFGKQWACSAGASAATGEVLAFFDADTWQAPDLITRSLNTMNARSADLLTVGGTQVLGSFWEKLIQPQVFSIILTRYGGTELVNDSPRPVDKIANGQCIFVRRNSYGELGGHAAVRDKVAEDLALAQLWFREGRKTVMILGLDQLFTRMYTSLRELVEGWGKNVYAGGIDAMPFGRLGQIIYPAALVMSALVGMVPFVSLALALTGFLHAGWLLFSLCAYFANLAWFLLCYSWLELPLYYALMSPLGSAVLTYIYARSVVRGRNVRWKNRDYVIP